mmetsp:Transcript_133341/g.298289  ORF Transcript_133341/g.298289 Transcript_133341/m.298289 type:complete len:86 (-) Transcript_133341:72-329(-)
MPLDVAIGYPDFEGVKFSRSSRQLREARNARSDGMAEGDASAAAVAIGEASAAAGERRSREAKDLLFGTCGGLPVPTCCAEGVPT